MLKVAVQLLLCWVSLCWMSLCWMSWRVQNTCYLGMKFCEAVFRSLIEVHCLLLVVIYCYDASMCGVLKCAEETLESDEKIRRKKRKEGCSSSGSGSKVCLKLMTKSCFWWTENVVHHFFFHGEDEDGVNKATCRYIPKLVSSEERETERLLSDGKWDRKGRHREEGKRGRGGRIGEKKVSESWRYEWKEERKRKEKKDEERYW